MKHSLTLFGILLLTSCSSSTTIEKSAPTLGSAEPISSEAWRESRGKILRTFAWRALENGLSQEATGYFQEACELNPEDASSHAAMARILLAGGDSRKALAFAERAVGAAPLRMETRLVWAAALAENGRDQEATAVLESAWEDGMQSSDVTRALITHYAASGQSQAANDFVDKILAAQPDSSQAWAAAGDLYLSEGHLEAAATAYGEALKLDSSIPAPSVLKSRLGTAMNDIDPVLSAAQLAEKGGDLLGAERLYRFLVDSNKGDREVISGLSRVLWLQGHLAQAQTTLNLINMENRDWREHLLQAKIEIRRQRWNAGKGSLLLALHQRPGLRAAELLLGLCDRGIAGEIHAN